MPKIWDYVDTFEKRFGTPAARSRACDMMIAYLTQLESPLPEIAAKGLEVGRQFHNGTTSDDERAQARKDCWDHLSKNHDWSSLTAEDFVIRAVIMVLDDPQRLSQDPVAFELGWFFTFVEKFEGYQLERFKSHSRPADLFLRQYFQHDQGTR